MADGAVLKNRGYNKGDVVTAYAFLFPSIVILSLFMFYPILYVFGMSLFETNKVGTLKDFVWLKNFAFVFRDSEFLSVVGRTIIWMVIGVSVKTFLGLFIALLLNVEYTGRKIARVLFILPWAAAVPISCMIWTLVVHPEYGLLNHTLSMLGIANPPIWLGAPIPAFATTMWVDIWLGVPFMALVFLAGMQGIAHDLYDAAKIDGANKVQQFFYVTLPGLRDVLFVAFLLSSLWTFNDFNVIYILTKGGPAGTTEILITNIYKNGFQWLKFSNAAVMSVVTFIILSVFSLVYMRLYNQKEQL